MQSAGNTAILLFTRTPRDESRHKTWRAGIGRQGHAAAGAAFCAARLPGLCAYGVACLCGGFQYAGRAFLWGAAGTRVCRNFARGYQHVISVGNDTLSLSPADLISAVNGLQAGRAVVGPSTDGGAYLIGLTRDQFAADAFAGLRWESPHVLDDLASYLAQQQAGVTYLAERRDIDTPADFSALLSGLPRTARIFRLIQSILASWTPEQLVRNIAFLFNRITGALALRAPPLSR